MNDIEITELSEVATGVALNAGALLKENFGGSRSIEYKGTIDIVTEMDRRAESLICTTLLEAFPSHGIMTEESSETLSDSGFRWIVDPLDGTTNYAHALPAYCVSIALEVDGEVRLGVVYNPMLDELFFATRGGGAFLNGERIEVSTIDSLDRSLLATGFPYDIRTSSVNNLDHFSNFATKVQAIRRLGSAALDICYTACGRFDGFWEMKIKPWDVAAASLVAHEAGASLSDFSANPSTIFDDEFLITNGRIHTDMLGVLALAR